MARAAAQDPTVVDSDQEVRTLLAEVAGVRHLGVANYCWFIDPAKALCLKLAGTPNATKPRARQWLERIITVRTGEAGDGWLCPMSSYPHDL